MTTQNPCPPSDRRLLTLPVTAALWISALIGVGGEPVAGDKLMLMHTMPWYESAPVRGRWGGHWTGFDGRHDPEARDADGLPDIWSHFHPLIGPYDSTDPVLLECQLGQMKLAGVDGVVVDWYGVAEALDYPAIHAASVALFAAAGQWGLSFAVCYEDRIVGMMADRNLLPASGAAARVAADLRWLDEHWFSSPTYATVGGRPILLNFGPISVPDASVWRAALDPLGRRPAFFALHHLWRQAGADGGFTWIHWTPWEGSPDEAGVRSRLREVFALPSDKPAEVIVSAWPGYQDVYGESRPTLDHAGGETLRISLDEALASPAKVVQLVTWNDYGEGTMIEPTHEFGYRFLEIVQAANRRRLGSAFRSTAADLRLPARLYAARKAGVAPIAALDAVAQAIRSGDCAAARAMLDRIDHEPVVK